MNSVRRRDYTTQTVDGMTIALREISGDGAGGAAGVPLVLMHGTRIPGISEFDLPVPNGSLAEDLALKGHSCLIPDARGFGRSQRPAGMARPAQESRPIARSLEITRDIDAAVRAHRAATGRDRVALMGWGVGGTASLMYAALWPEHVSHLILYDMIYGGTAEHSHLRSLSLEDPARPGRFNTGKFGGYNFNDVGMLTATWSKLIPIDDKDAWRDPAMVRAFEQALIDGDPTTVTRNPPSYRSPNGMLEDSYHMGIGRKLVHACQVYCKVMIIAPQHDNFSRPEDIAALECDLVNAEQVRVWRPADTTHYLLLDRPERGRTAAIAQIAGFLA